MRREFGYIIAAVCGAVVIAVTVAGIIFGNTNRSQEDTPEFVFLYAENQIEDYPTTKGTVMFADLVGLPWYDAGARNFYSTTPITCLEDFEGMNIRVQESDMMADMVAALGAKPAKIVYSEVYSALEQGIVDGAENNWPSYEAMGHYKVARYYTIDEHTKEALPGCHGVGLRQVLQQSDGYSEEDHGVLINRNDLKLRAAWSKMC